jgi:hypothetical protein
MEGDAMPMQAPLNLDTSCRSSGTLPDGRTVPLAWDLTTRKIMMKVAPYVPWSNRDNNKAAKRLMGRGGVYLAAADEWFRGVWTEAPQQVFDADYTEKQQKELASGRTSARLGSGALGLTSGGGGMQKSGSTLIEGDYEEVDEPEEEEDEEEGVEEGEGDAEAEPEEVAAPSKRKGKKAKGRGR